MTTRRQSSNIDFPFVPGMPDRTVVGGLKDATFTIQGDPSTTQTLVTPYRSAYVYLKSVTQISPGSIPSVEYVFHAVSELSGVERIYVLTFIVEKGTGLQGIWNDPSESSIGYLVVDGNNMYVTGDLVFTSPDYLMEPATAFWMNLQVSSLSFANEYRNFDPVQRTSLSNDNLKTFTSPSDVLLGNGYNVRVTCVPDNGLLDFNGGAGNGLGLAPDNMWDVGPAWGVGVTGIMSVNGVLPNRQGDIPVSESASVVLIPAKGSLTILGV